MPYGSNLLLDSIDSSIRDQIIAASIYLDLPIRTMLEDQGVQPNCVYFLTSGMASVVVELAEGGTAEVGLIACEGIVGASTLLGSAPPPTRCFMQIAGAGYRLPVPVLRSIFGADEGLRGRILQFIQQQMLTTSQLVACSQLHDLEPRLARWLLMVQDRVGVDVAHITHEFLAQMLGVHRPTVTVALGTLQRAGLIENNRGALKIVSHDELIKAACDCYPITLRLLRGLY